MNGPNLSSYAGDEAVTWRGIHFTFAPCEDCGTPDMDVIACFNVAGFCLDCCGCDHDGTDDPS